MNALERQMVDILIDLKHKHHALAAKAEFEAEGTRLDEAYKLKEIALRADLSLAIKIGGCEAVRDLRDAQAIGASRIVAPMIESPHALSKFLSATTRIFRPDEREGVEFYVNIETIHACRLFDQMLSIPGIQKLKGIVMGRVDLTQSLGIGREAANSREVYDLAVELFQKAKQLSLSCTLGGEISGEALPFLRALPNGLLDAFETRKVLFENAAALRDDAHAGLLKAIEFELLWLKNKRNYHHLISSEDEGRIRMLELRMQPHLN